MTPGFGFGGMGFGGGIFGFALMILFWGLVIVGVVFLIHSFFRKSSAGDVREEDAALEILRKRYARGEIDRKEFETKKKDLS